MPINIFSNRQLAHYRNLGLIRYEVLSKPYNLDGDFIHINEIFSPEQGCGFGTKVFRTLMHKSFQDGYEGSLTLDACYSSHLFHLFMGMEPIGGRKGYIAMKFGMVAELAVDRFLTLDCEERDFEEVRKIIAREKSILKNQITDDYLFSDDVINLLQHLKSKTESTLEVDFFPKLLCILKNNKNGNDTDTSTFHSVPMKMSEQGKMRWAKAIKNNQDFELFKNMSHLRPLMTPMQQVILDEIMLDQSSMTPSASDVEASSSCTKTFEHQPDIESSVIMREFTSWGAHLESILSAQYETTDDFLVAVFYFKYNEQIKNDGQQGKSSTLETDMSCTQIQAFTNTSQQTNLGFFQNTTNNMVKMVVEEMLLEINQKDSTLNKAFSLLTGIDVLQPQTPENIIQTDLRLS